MGTPIWITILVGVLAPAASLTVASFATRSSLRRLLAEQDEAKSSELREHRRGAYLEYLKAYDSFGAAPARAELDLPALRAAIGRAVEALSYVDLYGSEDVVVMARAAQSNLIRLHAAKIAGDTGAAQLKRMEMQIQALRGALVNILRLDLGMHEFNVPEEKREKTRKEYADRLRVFWVTLGGDDPQGNEADSSSNVLAGPTEGAGVVARPAGPKV